MSYLGSKTSNLDPVINYITNGRAYNSTEGWATYADVPGSQPVFGTGGSPNITWLRNTTAPLRQGADFNFAKDAANRQGEGVAYDISVDNADLAKVLTVTFDYEVLSGTYATGDLTVYLIQDPAGTPVVIQPAGYQVQAGTIGTKLKHIATFQTASNVNDYRLCFHVASTSTLAYTLAIDNVSVGPQIVQYGAPVTDWVAFTPTGSWTNNTTYTGEYRRVGDSLEVRAFVSVSGGAPNAATLRVNLPAGLSIDTTKLATSVAEFTVLGTGGLNDSSTTAHKAYVVYVDATSVGLRYQSAATSSTSASSQVSYNAPFAFNTGDTVNFQFSVPIQGWSSTVQMSNDTDTRVVAARYNNNTAGTTSPSVPFNFASKIIDTHNAVTVGAGVWKFVAPVPGIYRVSATTYSTGGQRSCDVYKNGSLYGTLFSINTTYFLSGSLLVDLSAGDYIDIRTSSSVTVSTGTASSVNIERLSGPSAIAASETVACEYQSNAGNTVANNTDSVFIDCATKIYDTHGAVVGAGSGNSTTATNTWRFVAPISGKYQVNAGVGINIPAGPNYWLVASIWVNGIKRTTGTFIVTNQWGTLPASGTVSNCIDLNAGDYVSLGFYQVSGAARNMWTSTTANYISIVRVGN